MTFSVIKECFKQFKWYEIVLMCFFMVAVTVLSVLAKSSVLTIITSLFGILYVGCLMVGLKITSVFGVVYTALYIAQSAIYHNWGELISQSVVVLPILIATVINWLRNSGKGVTVSAKSVGWKEWCVLASVWVIALVGYFFMLRAFNTPYLILASISGSLTLISNYLMMRKSIFMFLFFALNNLCMLLIWLMPVIEGVGANFETLPMLAVFVFLILSNLPGFINWRRMTNITLENERVEKEIK